ncbi:tRNA (guanosine(37)-N1)-methyltransferase TrmD [Candidatus Gottesmanbacteria bacterium]|nr:tRNA (guanosine(37)-N1)-methyltransferase TrmD [Candidatus Gottesmanbacteria bacterium]
MIISILTLFPDMFTGPFHTSIIKRSQEKGIVVIKLANIRDFATDNYGSVDDHPYGGGVGMILRVDVVDRALEHTKALCKRSSCKAILLDPQGIPYTQEIARKLSKLNHLILICGHYEGVDERIRNLVDEEISIGDYVLTGGEIPAMVVVDSVIRLLPGVLKEGVTSSESFSFQHPPSHLQVPFLEYPQYTRPEIYKGMNVPEVLLSGNHKDITQWRNQQSRLKTQKRRPDLLR